jgi:hypothetical protein
MRHDLLYHELIPPRSRLGGWFRNLDAELRDAAETGDGEFISAGEVLCNEQGCLTRLGDAASDVTASDALHLTEKASVFLVRGIIDRVLSTSKRQVKVSH